MNEGAELVKRTARSSTTKPRSDETTAHLNLPDQHNCFTLSLSGSDSHGGNSWRDDNDASMEIKVSSR